MTGGNLRSLSRTANWKAALKEVETGEPHLFENLKPFKGGESNRAGAFDGSDPGRLMSDLLRAFAKQGGAVPPEFLLRLAGMFDGGDPLKAVIRRPRGGRRKSHNELDIAAAVEDLCASGTKPYLAWDEVAKRFDCSPATARRAHAGYVDALRGDVEFQPSSD